MIRKLISFLCKLCNIQKFIVFNFVNIILFVTILCILYKEKPNIHSEINTIKKKGTTWRASSVANRNRAPSIVF